MIKNYKAPERVTKTDYNLVFYYEPGGGCSFPCDENGVVDIANLPDAAKKNLESALSHPEKYPVAWNHVEKRTYTYTEDATGTCKCGHKISLYNEYLGACECPHCGRWWNLFGDELKNPRRWNDYGELDYDY